MGKRFTTLSALLFTTCLTASATAQTTLSGNPRTVSEIPKDQQARCRRDSSSNAWIDKVQASSHTNLCRTVRWIDSLFGSSEQFDTEGFSGRVILGARLDEEEGFDPRLRVKIKSKLPNVSKRYNAFIGRFDEDEFITEGATEKSSIASRNNISGDDNEDASWLVGLGYSQKKDKGFDVSLGAKISGGLNPFALIRHRYLVTATNPNYLNLTQTVFWRRDERYGVSSELDYSYTLGDKDILGFGLAGKFTTEDDFWEAKSSLTWYHKFAQKAGLASSFFVRDSEEFSASLPEVGISLTYRQPFLREWSFIEFGLENRWEREQQEDERESFLRFGVQVEIQFGQLYEKNLRKN